MEEKQMKTLGGYEIVDEKARKDIETVSEKADEALSLAKGATKAFVYDTYSDMITELNALDKTELLVNFHVMIRTVCVPDLWISGVSDEHIEYTYTSNEDFITDLTEDGVVQVGYFVLSALETQKVELDEYVKKDDYATKDKAGVVYAHNSRGISVLNDGGLIISPANSDSVDSRSTYAPITGSILDYAVMKALSDSKLEWTEEQKQLARALLGSVGSEDYANSDNAGVVRVHTGAAQGLFMQGDKTIAIYTARADQIDKRQDMFKPITPSNIDYAVKKALSDCKLEGDDVWTEEEKAKALELLGGVAKIPEVIHNGKIEVYANTKGITGRHTIQVDRYATATKWAIPLRNSYSGIYIPDGAEVDDGVIPTGQLAVNRNYVDNLVGSVQSILTELHTYAQTKIGGEA